MSRLIDWLIDSNIHWCPVSQDEPRLKWQWWAMYQHIHVIQMTDSAFNYSICSTCIFNRLPTTCFSYTEIILNFNSRSVPQLSRSFNRMPILTNRTTLPLVVSSRYAGMVRTHGGSILSTQAKCECVRVCMWECVRGTIRRCFFYANHCIHEEEKPTLFSSRWVISIFCVLWLSID